VEIPVCPLYGGVICPHKVGQLIKQFLKTDFYIVQGINLVASL